MSRISHRFVRMTSLTVIFAFLFSLALLPGTASADTWGKIATDGIGGNYHPVQENVSSSAVFDGNLYFGMLGETGAEVWRFDGANWTQVNVDGFGDPANENPLSMAVYNNRLYVGTFNDFKERGTGCQVWRFDGPGSSNWTQVAKGGFGDIYNVGVYAMAANGGRLYAGTANDSSGAEVWAYDGTNWTRVNRDGFGSWQNKTVSSMAAWGGHLYAGAEGRARVFRYDGGDSWTQVNDDGFGGGNSDATSMAVVENRLYVGTWNNSGCEVWRYDGTKWTRVGDATIWSALNIDAESMAVLSGSLFIGTFNYAGCEVWRYDGTKWSQVNVNGFGDPHNMMAYTMSTWGGTLYAGTFSYEGAEVWRWHVGGTSWSQMYTRGFSVNGNAIASSMAVFQGSVFAGTQSDLGCEVYRHDGSSWTRLQAAGFGNSRNEQASSMAVYDGKLYVGTANGDGCEIWSFDGSKWARVSAGGFGDEKNWDAPAMAVFSGRLYVGTGTPPPLFGGHGCEVWSYDGARWTRSATGGFGDRNNKDVKCAAVWGSSLVMGTQGTTPTGTVWSFNGKNWTGIWGGEGHMDILGVRSLAVFGSDLYAGTYNDPDGGGEGCQVWKYTDPGTGDWEQVNVNGFGDEDNDMVSTMCVHDSKLYAGTRNSSAGGELWALEPEGWERENASGFGEPDNTMITSMVVHQASLLAGTSNVDGGCEIWKTKGSGPTPGDKHLWYLAEGSTGRDANGAFETWVCLQNSGSKNAAVELTYMTQSGEVAGPKLTVGPGSRATVDVSTTIRDEWSVSTRVTSDQPIVAERAMYWNTTTGVYRQAATDSIGIQTPSLTWYLAEGSTGRDAAGQFETWILVQNPGAAKAEARLFYMTPEGIRPGPTVDLEPGTRKTVNVGDTVPDEWSVATFVESDVPVIAERAMYWNTASSYRQAAQDSIGSAHPATQWYMAEGSTGSSERGSFETWILIQNPGHLPTKARLEYETPGGRVPGPTLDIGPYSRKSVNVADTVDDQFSVSTKVSSDLPVIAERAVYWDTPSACRQAATGSIGVFEKDTSWWLAEGSTGRDDRGYFETWVLVQNPNDTKAKVTLAYMTDRGPVEGPVATLEPGTRRTFNVADTLVDTWSVSTRVTSDRPVVVERAMYWSNMEVFRQAAHDSIGFAP